MQLVIIWHLHQPCYLGRDGTFRMPWVRLHAIRSYADMALAIDEVSGVRATFNFTPVLLDQIQAYVNGATDPWMRVASIPATDLSATEVRFLLRQFFAAREATMIRALPRWYQLFEKRKPMRFPYRDNDLRRFSTQELLDLQVLFFLGWTGFAGMRDPALLQLARKGRDFNEGDKAVLLAAHDRLLRNLIPTYRKLADAGRIELSTTPYFHPILPILLTGDPAFSVPASPGAPAFLFGDAAEAARQVRTAIARHEEAFGRKPSGMWPAEGAVSPEVPQLLKQFPEIRWIATDEEILRRSRSQTDALSREDLYRVYDLDQDGQLSVLFRDHQLSDKVGFVYSRWRPEEAAADLIAALVATAGDARRPPVASIILDGENPWETYANAGEDFLRAFYGGLAREPRVRCVTATEAVTGDGARARLGPIARGSWIDGSLATWVGHREKVAAWWLVARCLKEVGHAAQGPVRDDALSRAEGSDWFWWYGVDHESDHREYFDALFRESVKLAYERAGVKPPPDLDRPLIDATSRRPAREPVEFIQPSFEGEHSTYYDWSSAGYFEGRMGLGAMDLGKASIERVRYGFDRQHLYLRAEFSHEVGIERGQLKVYQGYPRERAFSPVRGKQDGMKFLRERWADACAIPWSLIAAEPGQSLSLALEWVANDQVLFRWPAEGEVFVNVPKLDFDLESWFV
ncbi:MAG: glycoside hydrolase family 57 protein [Planctomycetota bacterium]